jgi:hypothetical protein
LWELLAPYAGQLVVVAGGAFVYGAVDRFRAMCAAVLGDAARARTLFEHAIELERRIESTPLEARTRAWRTRLLGDPDGVDRAAVAAIHATTPVHWARRVVTEG